MHSPIVSVVRTVVILCRCVLSFLESTDLCVYVQPRSCAQVWAAPWVGIFPQCVSVTPCSLGGIAVSLQSGPRDLTGGRIAPRRWCECDSWNRERWGNWVLPFPAGVAHIWEWLLLIQCSVERKWPPSLGTMSVFSKTTTLSFLCSSW